MTKLAICGLAAVLLAGAEKPVATVVSLGPVRFNGVPLSARGICFWPVMNGDQLSTAELPGTLLLPGQTRATLYRDSSVRVRTDMHSGRTTLVLLQGQVGYTMVPGVRLEIVAQGRPVELALPSGTVRLEGGHVAVRAGAVVLPREPGGPAVLPRLAEYSAAATAATPSLPRVPSLGRFRR